MADEDKNSVHIALPDEEWIQVSLDSLHKDFQCPVCFGIRKHTMTVMECMHRFCQECIEKWIRLGNKECPTCRTPLLHRRALRSDETFDALVKRICPNIDDIEERQDSIISKINENYVDSSATARNLAETNEKSRKNDNH